MLCHTTTLADLTLCTTLVESDAVQHLLPCAGLEVFQHLLNLVLKILRLFQLHGADRAESGQSQMVARTAMLAGLHRVDKCTYSAGSRGGHFVCRIWEGYSAALTLCKFIQVIMVQIGRRQTGANRQHPPVQIVVWQRQTGRNGACFFFVRPCPDDGRRPKDTHFARSANVQAIRDFILCSIPSQTHAETHARALHTKGCTL